MEFCTHNPQSIKLTVITLGDLKQTVHIELHNRVGYSRIGCNNKSLSSQPDTVQSLHTFSQLCQSQWGVTEMIHEMGGSVQKAEK